MNDLFNTLHSINLNFSFTVSDILIFLGYSILVILFIVFLLKPILRILFMDTLLGDNCADFNLDTDKHLFGNFYLKKSKRGWLLFYIGDIKMKLEDGKRITERFFIFRKKDNTVYL